VIDTNYYIFKKGIKEDLWTNNEMKLGDYERRQNVDLEHLFNKLNIKNMLYAQKINTFKCDSQADGKIINIVVIRNLSGKRSH